MGDTFNSILIAHEDDEDAEAVTRIIDSEPTFRSISVSTIEDLIKTLKKRRFGCLIISLHFHNVQLNALINIIRSGDICDPGMPIIILTDNGLEALTLRTEFFVSTHNMSEIETIVGSVTEAMQSRPRPTALIVDDNEDYAADLGDFLSTGFQVTCAYSADEAITAFHARRPDIVITDYSMPHKDGAALTKKLREIDSEIPVVMLTMYTQTDTHENSVVAGTSAFISKETTLTEIEKRVRSLLVQSQKHRLIDDAARQRNELSKLLAAIMTAHEEINSGNPGTADQRLRAIIAKLKSEASDE